MDSGRITAWKQQWLRQSAAPPLACHDDDDDRGSRALIWPFHQWEETIQELEKHSHQEEKLGERGKTLYKALQTRYGSPQVIEERINALGSFLQESKVNHGFSSDAKTVIGCGSGRDRVFMGHSDLPGLGGMTLDAATKQELFVMMQWEMDSSHQGGRQQEMRVDMSNHYSEEFPSASFSLDSILELASALSQPTNESLLEKAKRIAKDSKMEETWDQKYWIGYVHAALTYMLSSLYYDHPLGYNSISPSSEASSVLANGVLKIHVGSLGKLTLPHTGGISSSAAMTGAVSLCLNQLFRLGLSTEELVTVDFAEYLLGKTSGTSDKAAQLFAQRGKLVATSSLPVQFLGTVQLPSDLKVLMCASPVPRLSTPLGLKWLKQKFDHSRARAINEWALHTLVTCGSTCTKIAANYLFDRLHENKWLESCGISHEEAIMLRESLRSHGQILLRGLILGEELEQKLQQAESASQGFAYRYSLIYRILKLIPVSCQLDAEGNVQPPLSCPQRLELYSLRGHVAYNTNFGPRGGAIYGLSEMERGKEFMRLCSAKDRDKNSDRLLQLLRLSQLGDKACVDYRSCYTYASRSTNEEGIAVNGWCFPFVEGYHDFMIATDSRLEEWTKHPQTYPLWGRCGSFQRSLPEFDELEAKIQDVFEGEASLRVAAAGLGGFAIVYCRKSNLQRMTNFLQENGWGVRAVDPGSRSQTLHCTDIRA
eukprot:gb/GECG01016568.1/.p1 GENE.gb/GECG01016568.1/~~gb/GECG01016568.1/.p1  ORF type:complete len:710 (+),score=71.98 gb/GECG01016568.1/:1-2130(+)